MDKNIEYEKRKARELIKHKNSEDILCKCGCGESLKKLDKWGREREYISGHNNRKYDDPKEHKRAWTKKHRSSKKNVQKDNNAARLRCQQHKVDLLLAYGGKCTRCGMEYDGENACCFDFHHRNPDTKEFNVNAATFNKFSKKRIYEEAKKCIVLCANCHRIIHRQNPY